jgi:hypothetical protein
MHHTFVVGLTLLVVSFAMVLLTMRVIVTRVIHFLPELGPTLEARLSRQRDVVIKVLSFARSTRSYRAGRTLFLARFMLAVYPNDAAPYQITKRMLISSARFASLQPGQLVGGKYDPQNLEKVEFDFKRELTEEQQAQVEGMIAHSIAPLPRVAVPRSRFARFIGAFLFLSIVGVVVGLVLTILGILT